MLPDILAFLKTMMKEEEIEEDKIDIETCVHPEISEEEPLAR